MKKTKFICFVALLLISVFILPAIAGCENGTPVQTEKETEIVTVPETEPVPEETTAAPDTTEAVPETTAEPEPPVTKRAVIAGGGAGAVIYREIYNMIGKKNSKAVVICTAGKDNVENVNSYVTTAKTHFKTNDVTALTLCTKLYDDQYLHDTIVGADVILVGGGQSEYMLDTWQMFKVDEYLKEAYNKGVLCCGASAGGMCWTYAGWNDFYGLPESEYKFFYGLDLVPIYYGPHFSNSALWAQFDQAIRKELTPKYNIGYAMENGAGLVFIDGVATKCVREDTNSHIYEYKFADGKWTRSEWKY